MRPGKGLVALYVECLKKSWEAHLKVEPQDGFISMGALEGFIAPSEKTYTLTNTGIEPLGWSVGLSAPWITALPASGTLAAGESAGLTVSFKREELSLLLEGEHRGEIAFSNLTNSSGNTSRGVMLTLTAGPLRAGSISQYGITWTFDKPYRVGRFVNGDWWMVPDEAKGTVTVVSVEPAPSGMGASARNGSMRNPMGALSQSYDGRAERYTELSKVVFPLQLAPWDSLMSSISRPDDDGIRSDVWNRPTSLSRVKLLTMAVLTCMPHDSTDLSYKFRPPYSHPFSGGPADKPLYDARNINWSLLPSIAPSPGYPSMAAGIRGFQRVCPMHASAWLGEQIRPVENCGGYYSSQHSAESRYALLMFSDPAIVGDRTELVRNFIQFGIDTLYALRSYDPQDSTRNDRVISKWPMVFAGLMLNDPDMRNIPSQAYIKTEETSYGPGWTGADVIRGEHELLHYTSWCAYQTGGSGFKAETYRRQTHSWNWVGTALAARLMNAEAAWDHPAFFDYVDRWMLFGKYANDDANYGEVNALAAANPCGDNPPLTGIGYRQGIVPGEAWVKSMWDQYRSS